VALAVLLIGILLVASGLRGTERELGAQLSNDFTGNDGFVVWLGAIVLLGLISKIPGFEKPVQYLMALIVVSIVLANPTVFTSLKSALVGADTAGPAPAVPLPAIGQGSGQGGGGGAGATIGQAVQAAGIIGEIGSLF